jgi:hypothetical protein
MGVDENFVNNSITGQFFFHNRLTINFSDNFKEQLVDSWNSYDGNEYSACIIGYKEVVVEEGADRYSEVVLVLNSMYNFNTGSKDYVDFPSCDNINHGVVAVVHSHPGVGCRDKLWTGDVTSARRFWSDGGSLYIIQCAEDKVEVYGREDMWNGKIINFENG